MAPDSLQLGLLAAGGVVAGLVLLVRGMRGYLESSRITDTATSPIESLAAGEVRISGAIEAADVLLVSPLQSHECVWYRADVTESRGRDSARLLHDERSVGFRVRDATGSIRVFPRGARIDAPDDLHAATDPFGGDPPGLDLRRGSALAPTAADRGALVAKLLAVRPDDGLDGDLAALGGMGGGSRRYREARLDPGDVVTIVGAALPFAELADPEAADLSDGPAGAGTDDPEVAADLTAARLDGSLAPSADAAWGNAAIPGFGIGRPTRTPTLDPLARPEPAVEVASSDASGDASRFDIGPDELVVALTGDVPLLVVAGAPGLAASRGTDRFAVGLAGAAVSILSAIILAVVVGGAIR
ncbi:MAG TPA: hypothetical protein VGK63_09025 [Candidatus Limnocylindrales bacterium]